MDNNKLPIDDIIRDCKNCQKVIPVCDGTEMLLGTMEVLVNNVKGQDMKDLLDDPRFNYFMSVFICSFLTTLYANIEFDNEEDKIKYAEKMNADDYRTMLDPDGEA